jgi:hypothetical protein
MEEAEQEGLDHLGEAIDSFQEADLPRVVSYLETTLSVVKEFLEADDW